MAAEMVGVVAVVVDARVAAAKVAVVVLVVAVFLAKPYTKHLFAKPRSRGFAV